MKKLAFLWVSVVFGATPYAATPTATASPSFDVMEYVVEGNTVLPNELVERALNPYLGPDKSFKDIEAARTALEKIYQDSGFLSVVVSLPNQRVDTGEVRLEVTEATVEKLNVTGAQYHLPSAIKAKVPSLTPGQTPYFPQVQEELAQLQTGDQQVTPLIGAGDDPAKIQVDLKVEDKLPWHGSIEANSRQSFNTRRGRLEAVASYSNLWQLGHTVGVSWQYAPTRPADANTLTLIYGLPLSSSDDLNLSLTDSRSDTPTNTSLGGATLTRGRFYGLRWQHQLDAQDWPVRHSLYGSLDYKDNHDSNQEIGGFTTAKPPLRYPVLSLGYNLAWQGAQDQLVTVNTSWATSSSALAGRTVDCNGRSMDQFECKRAGSSPDFLVWKAGLGLRQPLFGHWQVNAHADAQIASGPLASGEQYSLGGVDSVRGYYDAEQAGDMGWATRLELISPVWAPFPDLNVTGLAFFDRGFVLLKNPLPSQKSHIHLGSTGLGWRADNSRGLQLSLDVALPLLETQRAADSGAYESATKRRVRVDLSLRQSF
ncbi:MAG: ShlB/FhaC/HecB family hemolysin secretion/activation protein [Burkholderiales bacterium]|nr:ShlB/FhaC/HecB family hemolysin secretion/activation protein [Burkholderiales bacterium]